MRNTLLALTASSIETVWIAVSGGRDSVALFRMLASWESADSPQIRVIHIDHGLRPDSENDAHFVAGLANEHRCECDVIRLPAAAHDGRLSEDQARRLRYDAIAETVLAAGDNFVAIAHTADDQAETILHRIIRGSGVPGLVGIPARRVLSNGVTLIRPILELSRSEVTSYLEAIGEDWRDDPTNATDAFTRNRIRIEIIPLLETLNPQVKDALIRLGTSAGQHALLVDQLASDWVVEEGNGPSVPIESLKNAPPLVIAEVLRKFWRNNNWPEQGMTRSHWDGLVDLVVVNKSKRHLHLPGGITACRTRTAVEFSANGS